MVTVGRVLPFSWFLGVPVALVEHPSNAISQRVIGAAIEVHRHLGPGLLESSYHACLCQELDIRGIAYQSKVMLPFAYKGVQIRKGYVIDLLVEDMLVVEIKSVESVQPIHSAQLMTYLRLKDLQTGLLINFNVVTLVHGLRRILR
jgi:GxxExxY protein